MVEYRRKKWMCYKNNYNKNTQQFDCWKYKFLYRTKSLEIQRFLTGFYNLYSISCDNRLVRQCFSYIHKKKKKKHVQSLFQRNCRWFALFSNLLLFFFLLLVISQIVHGKNVQIHEYRLVLVFFFLELKMY